MRSSPAYFFELAEQPQEAVLVVGEDEAARLLERLDREGSDTFFVKSPLEFGILGEPD